MYVNVFDLKIVFIFKNDFFLLLLSVCVRGCIGITGHFQRSQDHFHESVIPFLYEFWGLNLGCQAWTESKRLVKVPTEPSHWPRNGSFCYSHPSGNDVWGYDARVLSWMMQTWPCNFSSYPREAILSTIIKLHPILLHHSSLSYVHALLTTYPLDTWRIS